MNAFEKSLFGAIAYVFSYLNNCVNEMIIVLSILMIFDYITGVILSKKENTFDSKIGIWGAVKKLCYLMILITGYLADLTINSLVARLGMDFQTYGSLGFAVVFYLIGNEGVSLYTNWIKLGLPAPQFLFTIFQSFKKSSKSITKK